MSVKNHLLEIKLITNHINIWRGRRSISCFWEGKHRHVLHSNSMLSSYFAKMILKFQKIICEKLIKFRFPITKFLKNLPCVKVALLWEEDGIKLSRISVAISACGPLYFSQTLRNWFSKSCEIWSVSQSVGTCPQHFLWKLN